MSPIPEGIQQDHILKALELLKQSHWPKQNNSTKFDLFWEGSRFPPKVVIAEACRLAGIPNPITVEDFSGGDEANSFLQARGFVIIDKDGVPRHTHVALAPKQKARSARPLELYGDYTREEVHDIFSPHTRFTKSTGQWGLWGFAPVPNRDRDYVFFVTFGRRQGEHTFDEGITSDGVLTWQSQPSQDFSRKEVKQWISHDELEDNIHLFLRTANALPYTYLGRLKYKSHDSSRVKPVHFKWQILDWNLTDVGAARIGLTLDNDGAAGTQTQPLPKETLIETAPPPRTPPKGLSTPLFRANKRADFSDREAKQRNLGLAGELLVVKLEQKRLTTAGRNDLADKVRHAAVILGDGVGYDVESFDPSGEPLFIEVKTTRGADETPFFLSENELKYSHAKPHSYRLYRVYEYDDNSKSGKFFTLRAPIEDEVTLTPTAFRVMR